MSSRGSFGDLWHFGAVPDPYLWLVDPDLDQTPDPTPFLSNFKDAKKINFCSNFSLITHPQAQYIQSYEKKEGGDPGGPKTCGSCGSRSRFGIRIPNTAKWILNHILLIKNTTLWSKSWLTQLRLSGYRQAYLQLYKFLQDLKIISKGIHTLCNHCYTNC